ncbi:hypothetical protein ACG9Y7_06410 [Acinetobacter gerneri]|uniref:hypothetical protein n=1 Tax=Acinetobacter gerneri TaxID=202952 RepID=UPI003AF70158
MKKNMETMQSVYHVKVNIEQNPNHVKKVQALTLNQSRPMHGLKGTYGLYGSQEWLNNLDAGIIPQVKISGIIQRIYTVDMDNGEVPDTIDIKLDDSGKIVSKGIFVNNKANITLFKVGKRVDILYYLEEMKAMDYSTGEQIKHEFVFEMAVAI